MKVVTNIAIWDGQTAWPIDGIVKNIDTLTWVGQGMTYDPVLDEFISPQIEEPPSE